MTTPSGPSGTAPSTWSERALAMQGFPMRTDPSLRRVAPWLRLTPSLSTLWILSGLVLESPRLLVSFAAVSAFGASRRRHPFDRLYDRAVRPLAGSAPLPDNPPPRRFAMGLAAAMAATSAALLAGGRRRTGLVVGALLGAAAVTVSTTHFCAGSWIYRHVFDSLPATTGIN